MSRHGIQLRGQRTFTLLRRAPALQRGSSCKPTAKATRAPKGRTLKDHLNCGAMRSLAITVTSNGGTVTWQP